MLIRAGGLRLGRPVDFQPGRPLDGAMSLAPTAPALLAMQMKVVSPGDWKETRMRCNWWRLHQCHGLEMGHETGPGELSYKSEYYLN